MKSCLATLSGRRAGSRRRTETTSAPGGERVQPLGRRRHPGADDRDAGGVLVRLVGVDDAGIGRELGRQREPGVAGGQQDVPKATVPVELEAAVDRPHALDPRRRGSSRPSGCRSRSSSTWRRNSATVGR